MTIGVGGSTAEKELAAMSSMRGDVPPIGIEERLRRIARAQAIMREKGIDALYLDVSSSMTYFTGLKFRRTERMHSAVLPAKGDIVVTWGSEDGAPYVPGVPVGRVTAVFSSLRQTSQRAVIAPFVDFGALDVVGVVVPSGTHSDRSVVEADGSLR